MAARPEPEDFEEEEPLPPPVVSSPAVPAGSPVATGSPVGDGGSADDLLDAALADDPLTRKMRRAALRKQKITTIVESDKSDGDKSSDKSRERRRRKRSRSTRRRKGGNSSDEEERKEQQRMYAALRPLGMVHQGIGRGSMDVVTGGVGFGGMGMAAPTNAEASGGLLALAAQTGQNQVASKVCIRFLQGMCLKGELCMDQHPNNPWDVQRWIQYFNKQPCKFGDACPQDRCIYDHPNRRGYSGAPEVVAGTAL